MPSEPHVSPSMTIFLPGLGNSIASSGVMILPGSLGDSTDFPALKYLYKGLGGKPCSVNHSTFMCPSRSFSSMTYPKHGTGCRNGAARMHTFSSAKTTQDGHACRFSSSHSLALYLGKPTWFMPSCGQQSPKTKLPRFFHAQSSFTATCAGTLPLHFSNFSLDGVVNSVTIISVPSCVLEYVIAACTNAFKPGGPVITSGSWSLKASRGPRPLFPFLFFFSSFCLYVSDRHAEIAHNKPGKPKM